MEKDVNIYRDDKMRMICTGKGTLTTPGMLLSRSESLGTWCGATPCTSQQLSPRWQREAESARRHPGPAAGVCMPNNTLLHCHLFSLLSWLDVVLRCYRPTFFSCVISSRSSDLPNLPLRPIHRRLTHMFPSARQSANECLAASV